MDQTPPAPSVAPSAASPSRARPLAGAAAMMALSLAAAVHGQGPRVIYVDDDAPAGGTGTGWSTAYKDLQDALDAAKTEPGRLTSGVEIRLAQGVYLPDRGTGNMLQRFVVSSGVTLLGGFAGLGAAAPDARDPDAFVSRLSGDLAGDDGPNFGNRWDNSAWLLRVANSATLDGCTVSGAHGTLSASNGAIVVEGVIRACVVEDCIAYDYYSLIVAVRGTFSGRIVNNWSRSTPIVYAQRSTFLRCAVRGNVVGTDPGASPSGYGNVLTLWECTLAASKIGDNITYHGSTLALNGGTLARSSIAGNTAAYGSGAWINPGSSTSVTNCVISGNVSASATWPEQVFLNHVAPSLLQPDTLVNTGAAGVRCWPTPCGPGQVSVLAGDPRFVSPAGPDGDPATWQDNDYRLRPDSPAIDAGRVTDAAQAAAYRDLLGLGYFDVTGRPNTGTGVITFADLGCYEHHCAGNFDASTTQDILDIFAFLEAWFAGDPRADFNRLGGVDLLDVFAFLQAWFDAC